MLAHHRLEAKSIPPCSDGLKLHSRRANYHTNFWRNCLQQNPQTSPSNGYGCDQDGNGVISIKWKTVQPASDETFKISVLWDLLPMYALNKPLI